jgi:hypothetical protein
VESLDGGLETGSELRIAVDDVQHAQELWREESTL